MRRVRYLVYGTLYMIVAHRHRLDTTRTHGSQYRVHEAETPLTCARGTVTMIRTVDTYCVVRLRGDTFHMDYAHYPRRLSRGYTYTTQLGRGVVCYVCYEYEASYV